MNLADKIRTVPNWPIEGVMFRDITTILQDPSSFRQAIDLFYERYTSMGIDKIAAIDARGFLFGSVLAYRLEVGLVPVRKKGKLPYKTISADYDLEYGTDTLEIHQDAIESGESVLIIDDLIATGGTVSAAAELVERLGGQVVECAFLVELSDLKGRQKIDRFSVFSLTEFQGG
ncbi:MAG TPA: adenine phosphoribosyltransferase [Pseudomonadales bacterium]|jgi:adenine phosphoribosyltransferase|nr:adenine phosphoribosyltransferase [Gammaproteobacteria bacterium]MDP6025313.1 adenine phosphoribosyltransferase [Pseudomonadales bacterium]MDP6315093.1 adenine phosphoribosyltransferase [Pseudomonadales bacterium]MDP7315895.1 adenine phosphoribosyltransferase [Pseudomonadales bacterium]HJP52290.1 adenine phosphoribosyltransferase [Pseudomonadales bacterium]|tara:strand:+ start:1119 stop:1640 length:522 start_codon:yes stop_codon:yes gene_type:complete